MPQEDKKSKIGYWQRWLSSAKKAAKTHFDDSKAAWAEYENEKKILDSLEVEEKRTKLYPAYFTAIKTIEPAYYSRTPKVVTHRDFDIDDEFANFGSVILERLAKYGLERHGGFDDVMQYAVLDFIHADKTTVQILYDYKERAELQASGDNEIVFHDEQNIRPAPVPFDEILHSPEAKTWSEIKEIAYMFRMTLDEAKERFTEEKLKGVPIKVGDSKGKDEDEKILRGPDSFIEGWEVWCKTTKKVYWIVENHPQFLDIKDDPFGLRNFFPSPPFVISNRPRKHLYPTPTFVHLEPTILQMHKIYRRIFSLIHSIRRRALVEGASPELIAALNNLDSEEFIAVQNFQDLVQKAQSGGLVWYIPVEELVTAITELNALQEKFDDLFYRWIGVPDILRGETDPIETKGAQVLKTNAAHDRFKYQKKQIAKLARDTIEIIVDLQLKVFSAEKIFEIAGVGYMAPERQAAFPQVLAMLQNDEQRIIHIDIETDSLTFLDEEIEIQKRSAIVNTVIEGLQRIGQIENDEFTEVALKTLLYSLSGLHGSKEFEDSVKKAVKDLVARKAEPQPEPPPDPDQMKIQLQQQKLELQSQIEGQKLQLQAQKDQMESFLKNRELDQKEFKITQDGQMKGQELQIDSFRAQLDHALVTLEGQRVEIERFKSEIQAQETMLEEIRLAKEVEARKLEAVLSGAENKAPEPQIITLPSPEMPPINIKLDVTRPGKKVGRIIRDAFGNATVEVEENP